jgi:hypothetical protein
MAAAFEGVKNATFNLFVPVYGGKRLIGQGTHVALEVGMQKMIRKMIGRDTRGWVELTMISYLSSIYQGAFAAPFGEVMGIQDESSDNTVVRQTIEGAKMSASVLLADYIYQTSVRGLHLPWKVWSFVDLLYLLGGKSISRTVEKLLVAMKVPGVGTEEQDAILAQQVKNSILRMGDA